MRNIVFVTHSFPPYATAGVGRALGFVKYLPEFGWLPWVITVRDNPAYCLDKERLEEVPQQVRVEYTRQIPLQRFVLFWGRLGMSTLARGFDRLFCFPDSAVGWVPMALRKASQVARITSARVVYTTSPPESTHIVGYLLKRKFGLRWVADFRNEWSTNPYRQRYPTELQRKLHERLERKFLSTADAVLTLSPWHTEMLKASDPENAAKYHTIENGFDGHHISETLLEPVLSREQRSPHLSVQPLVEAPCATSATHGITDTAVVKDDFIIAYAGSFYARQRPDALVMAIQDLIQDGELDPKRFRLRVAGYGWEASRSLIGKPYVEFVGLIPHSEVWNFYRNASVLLLMVAPDAPRTLPGKAYEYIATGKPILALVPPDGLAGELVRQTRTGIVVKPDDKEEIKGALLAIYKDWKAGKLTISPDVDEIMKYERRRQVEELARILDEVVQNRYGSVRAT